MSTAWQRIQQKMLHSGSRVTLLIWINIIVFLVIHIPATLEPLFLGRGHNFIGSVTDDYITLPSFLPLLLRRFWTPVSYMFMHVDIFHILFNMLWLYWMGQIFEEYLGTHRVVGLYILGGLAGAFFYVLFYNISPLFVHEANIATLEGASAAIMAIIVATATLLPDYEIYIFIIGAVRLKWIVLFVILVDFFGITGFNAGGELSHLGGALFGFLYIKELQRGNDMVAFFNKLFKKRSKLKVAVNNPAKPSSKVPRQEDIDRILDKISQSGYDSLSKQEKEILFRASKNNEG